MIAKIPATVLNFLNRVDYDRTFYLKKTRNIDELRDFASDLLYKEIRDHYVKHDFKIRSGIFNFLVEPLKNANFYSDNREQATEVNLLLSPHALIASYKDGGTYFTREDVKCCYETKTKHSDKHEKMHKELGYGIGTDLIYHVSDLIHVDTALNKLYIGITTKNTQFVPINKETNK